jgi:hypothetical protein
MDSLTRVRYCVFDSREEAISAGWPDAEYGDWQRDPAIAATAPGWIALTADVEAINGALWPKTLKSEVKA